MQGLARGAPIWARVAGSEGEWQRYTLVEAAQGDVCQLRAEGDSLVSVAAANCVPANTEASEERAQLLFRIDQRKRQIDNIKLIARGMVGRRDAEISHPFVH